MNDQRVMKRCMRLWVVAAAAVLGFATICEQVSAQQAAPKADPAAPAPAAAPASELAAKIAARIRVELESQKLVALSVAIARGDKVLLTHHEGFEDREHAIAATDVTMYRWASVSKPMTAVVAMQLAADHKLDLDADVRTLVPEFPDKGKTITTRQLLCHQGGIVHYSNGPVVRTRRQYEQEHPFADVVTALDMFKESPLVAGPGEKYSYTTHGYMLLGAVVQRAGKEPFAQRVHNRIAAPLGMETLRPDYQWEAIPHRAVGYERNKAGEVVPSSNTDVSWKLAGGGWISNVGDMARFGAGMLGTKLVDQGTREQMWTDQPDRAGKPTGYGLGFGVQRRAGEGGGERIISHSGSQEKTATHLLIRPGQSGGGIVVAVMCNTEGAKLAALAWDLSELAAGRELNSAGGIKPVEEQKP